MQKICSNNRLGDEMENSNYYEQKDEEKGEIVASAQKRRQKEYSNPSISGRPNIDEISKRNKEAEKRERKFYYTVAGIIVLFTAVVVVLIYFFS